MQRSPPVHRRGSGACPDTRRSNKLCATTFWTHSVFPDSTSPRKLNPVEPPWYGPVCPVVGEGWHREVPPYPDQSATLHIELFTQFHYRESIRDDADLSELYKDVFFHWKKSASMRSWMSWSGGSLAIAIAAHRQHAVGRAIGAPRRRGVGDEPEEAANRLCRGHRGTPRRRCCCRLSPG
jgi:hypothetical protein